MCIVDTPTNLTSFAFFRFYSFYIIPIFKSNGTQTSPEKYRPITILSCNGKLFTYVLNERLIRFVEHYAIMEENQAGLMKEHSTIDHIFVLNTLT